MGGVRRAVAVAAVTLSVACGDSGAVVDAGQRDAAPADAASAIDAAVSPDQYPTYGACNLDAPDCPPEHPYCGWNGCLECVAECADGCFDQLVDCVETPPAGAVPCGPADAGPPCPAEQPYCCEHNTRVCADRALAGWDCAVQP